MAQTGATACSGPLLTRYSAQPSLLAAEPDTVLRIQVHGDGCVVVAFPRHDLRHGTRVLRPDRSALSHLDGLLEGLAARHAAQAKGAQVGRRWHSDPALITLERFAAGKRMRSETWLAAPLWEHGKSDFDDPRTALQRAMHALAEQSAPTP